MGDAILVSQQGLKADVFPNDCRDATTHLTCLWPHPYIP